MEIDLKSQTAIAQAVEAVKASQASVKTAFSSYTHASFDQASRILTGDARWNELAQRVGPLGVNLQPFIWEMQPPGDQNDITLLLPLEKEIIRSRIRSDLASLPWWAPVTPLAQSLLARSILCPDRWGTTAGMIPKQLKETYPQGVIDKVMQQYVRLRDLYQDVFVRSYAPSLVQASQTIYERMALEIFGAELASAVVSPKTGYFASGYGEKVLERAIEKLSNQELSPLLRRLNLSDTGLFVSGSWEGSFMVQFSSEKNSLVIATIDQKSGEVEKKPRVITEEELEELLYGEVPIRVTGKLFDVLMLTEQSELVIHDGNDFGGPLAAKKCLPELRGQYVHVFEDSADSFPPISFLPKADFPNPGIPSLASLFLWNIKPGLWAEKLMTAIKTGETQPVILKAQLC